MRSCLSRWPRSSPPSRGGCGNRAAYRRAVRRPRYRRERRLDRHVRAACSTRASAASSRFPARANASAPNGISSATSRICRPRARSCCSTAAGTTAPASRKVMGFCTPEQTQDFLNAAPEFERHLVDDGMLLFKYWLCCDQAVQEERFENRLQQPDEALEAVADRCQGARPLRRLHRGARDDAVGDAHRFRAVDAGRFQRPAARPADVAARLARPGARHRIAARGHSVAAARSRAAEGALRRAQADRELSGPEGKHKH